ncbi:MAG TPA: response regulator [Coleofasciculaceae cyanobacterium]
MQPEPKVNVLLVDDHPENLIALEAMLEGLGQHLIKAQSGEEALRCLLNQDFAVILLDVQMPGMDGFETATLIRHRPRSQHTPIIFLTAYSKSDTQMFKGYSLGAVDYLYKPIDPEILTSKVAVFVDLFKKTEEVKHQAAQLEAVNAELKESEERFRLLSACSPVGIFLTDVEGRCTYTNPRFQALCGLGLEESLGEGWLHSVHPEDRPQVKADWFTRTQSNGEYSSEFRCKTPDGMVRQVHVRASPMLCEQGKLLGHVGTLEDITERKQAEEARTQVIREQAARKEAEAANRMKDEFLATLSHELRTPLHSVLGWARLLRTRSFDAATTARALETIERNAQAQAQLIEDILDVSRIIRGKLQLNLRPIKLISAIEAAVDSVRLVAETKSIQVETCFDPEVERVMGDPDRLQQIVWNLLSNAIKFTPEGGTIEVRTLQADAYARIQVRDTGIGIKEEFLPYVFDRFRQADSTTTRSHGGLGLGLAIVRHLVDLHHGRVYADSEGEGKGSTFTIELPIEISAKPQHSCLDQTELEQDGESSRPEPPAEISNMLCNLRVLIVDDEPDVRELLTTVIEGSGGKAIAVASVPEAIKTLEQIQPDILVSDIGMPIEDGYTLIRKVRDREAERGGHLPAIALTAYAREEDCQQAIESGFEIYLSKPIDTAQLVRVVANLVTQRPLAVSGET